MSSNNKRVTTTDEGGTVSFGNRNLNDPSKVFEHNSWDNVDMDKEQIDRSLEIIRNQIENKMDLNESSKYLTDCASYWNAFYSKHEANFFKDRHWLSIEFPELFSNSIDTIFEVGCGAGNTVFPLIESYMASGKKVKVHACDFSKEAISIVQSHKDFQGLDCNAFVYDIANDKNDITEIIAPNSVDICILIFVLSAIEPSLMKGALNKLYRVLKPGGLILFRDYSVGDLTQLRFKGKNTIQDNFYIRGDGTCVYFFGEEETKALFENVGFRTLQNALDRRLLVNRQRQLKMYRIWIQGKYQKPCIE